MDLRICPNCGESCEKEFETVFVRGQEYCVCCNYNIEKSNNDNVLEESYIEDPGERNNAFVDFFNESGLLKIS